MFTNLNLHTCASFSTPFKIKKQFEGSDAKTELAGKTVGCVFLTPSHLNTNVYQAKSSTWAGLKTSQSTRNKEIECCILKVCGKICNKYFTFPCFMWVCGFSQLCLSDIEAVLVLNHVFRCALPSKAASVGTRVLITGACVTPAIWAAALGAFSSALSFVFAASLKWWREM